MPHLTVEYSGNLEREVDMSAFCNALRLAIIETELFPVAGIRVRALRCDHWSIADGTLAHAFIDMGLRLRGGRTPKQRKAAAARVFAEAKAFLTPVLESRSLALSLELRDIDPESSRRTSTIRQHLKGD